MEVDLFSKLKQYKNAIIANFDYYGKRLLTKQLLSVWILTSLADKSSASTGCFSVVVKA